MRTLNRRQLLGGSAALAASPRSRRTAAAKQATPVASPQAPVVISTTALDDLRSRLNGTLMLPGDSGYAAARAPANGRYADILPVAVARCADEADVVTCINWCNENGVPPVGRGGGHSYAGFSTTTGLLIDLRRLNSVVSTASGTASPVGAPPSITTSSPPPKTVRSSCPAAPALASAWAA